jgi:anti-sigma-K factor RskA
MSSEIHDLVGAYCVDAVDAAERAAFEAHLPACAQCREEVAASREALAALAGARSIPPPRWLEEAVVAAAAEGARAEGPVGDPTMGPVAGPGVGPVGGPVAGPAWGPGTGRSRGWRVLAAAAAAAIVFAGGTALGRLTAPSAPEVTIAAPMEVALAVAAAADAQMVPVEVMGAPSRVVVSGEMGKAVFLAEDLPTPAKGQCYQVWRVGPDGAKSSAGVFTPGPDGHVVAVLEAGPGTSSFVITVEPPGGSKEPSGPMVGQADA